MYADLGEPRAITWLPKRGRWRTPLDFSATAYAAPLRAARAQGQKMGRWSP